MLKKTSYIFLLLLITACGSTLPETRSKEPLPDPLSSGAKIFIEFCTACHGYPNPAVHKAEEWRNVVSRMNTRRIKRALGEIPQQQMEVLIQYLESNAGL